MSDELNCKNNSCNADVDSFTEQVSESVIVIPTTITPGTNPAVVVKIPVVLAETKIIIPVVSEIRLESKAFEIKRIKKNVFVTQCHLIPNSSIAPHNTTGILYLEGFVRKNIEYATKDCMDADGTVSGSINHTTVKVLFSSTTRVTFRRQPQIVTNNVTTEFEMFNDTLKTCDICAEDVIGKDPCEEGFIHNELFNEKVYCELISADIVEADIHKNPKSLGCDNPEEQIFNKITEKMVLAITIKLLQKQQVNITALLSPTTPATLEEPCIPNYNEAVDSEEESTGIMRSSRRIRKLN